MRVVSANKKEIRLVELYVKEKKIQIVISKKAVDLSDYFDKEYLDRCIVLKRFIDTGQVIVLGKGDFRPKYKKTDINKDGKVDGKDLSAVMTDFNKEKSSRKKKKDDKE